jgi:hypothetical protein
VRLRCIRKPTSPHALVACAHTRQRRRRAACHLGRTNTRTVACVGARHPRTVRIRRQSKAEQSKAAAHIDMCAMPRASSACTLTSEYALPRCATTCTPRRALFVPSFALSLLLATMVPSFAFIGTLIRLIGIASFARSARLVSACCSTARPSTPKRPSHWKADARVRGTERRGDIAHAARAPKGLRRGQGRSGPLPAAAPRAAAATAGRSSVRATARRITVRTHPRVVVDGAVDVLRLPERAAPQERVRVRRLHLRMRVCARTCE